MQTTRFHNIMVFTVYIMQVQSEIHYNNSCTIYIVDGQTKGFYHGITKILQLVGSYTMPCWHFGSYTMHCWLI